MLQGCFVPVSLPHCRELMMALTPELPWQAARNIWPESQWRWIWVVKKKMGGKNNNKTKPNIKNRSKKTKSFYGVMTQPAEYYWTGPGASLCTTGPPNWPSVFPAAPDWLRSTGFVRDSSKSPKQSAQPLMACCHRNSRGEITGQGETHKRCFIIRNEVLLRPCVRFFTSLCWQTDL